MSSPPPVRLARKATPPALLIETKVSMKVNGLPGPPLSAIGVKV
jgi:hypothetical protein